MLLLRIFGINSNCSYTFYSLTDTEKPASIQQTQNGKLKYILPFSNIFQIRMFTIRFFFFFYSLFRILKRKGIAWEAKKVCVIKKHCYIILLYPNCILSLSIHKLMYSGILSCLHKRTIIFYKDYYLKSM